MMRYYTPKQALKVVRFRQELHHALSVIAAGITFCGICYCIMCAEGQQIGLGIIGFLGTVAAGLLSAVEDYIEIGYREDERKILAEYGEELV